MSLQFNKLLDKYLSDLELYVPTVAKVHGGTHPEFLEVKNLYDLIIKKVQANSGKPELADEFTELRNITNNYKVPEDTCETYEAVYQMLKKLDAAYMLTIS